MNKKGLYLLIAGLVIFGGAALLYVFWDRDEDKISPMVALETYDQSLLHAIMEMMGKPFDQLSTDEKMKALTRIVREGKEIPRIAAMRKLSEFAGEAAVMQTIISGIDDSIAGVAEEAIHVIHEKNIREATGALEAMIQRVSSAADATMPYSDITSLAVFGKMEQGDVKFDFKEYQQRFMSFSDSLVSEINLFLPKGADYYLSLPNFDNTWRDFESSALVEKFTEQPAYKDLADFEPTKDFFAMKELVDQKLSFLSKYLTPDRIFRDDLKFARYPSGKLLVTFAGKNLEIAQEVFSVLKSGKDGRQASEKNILGEKVTTVHVGRKIRMSFAQVGDYFILSDSPALLERSIITFKEKRQASITALPEFQQSYKELDPTGKTRFMYLFCKPTRMLKISGTANSSRYLKKIALDALQHLSGDSDASTKFTHEQPAAPERFTALLRTIPHSIIGFSVSKDWSSLDYWRYITAVKMQSSSALDSLKAGAGIDIGSDVLGKLDRGAFLAYAGVRYGADYESNVSATQFVIGVSSATPQMLVDPLTRVYTYLFRNPVQQEKYNGYDVFASQERAQNTDDEADTTNVTIEKLRDLPISPAFAIVDQSILLGMNATVLKHFIDAYKGGKPQYFSEKGFPKEVQELGVLRTGAFLDNFYSFLRRYSRRTTSFTDVQIEERLKPLISLLKANLSINGWAKEIQTIYHGQCTIDLK